MGLLISYTQVLREDKSRVIQHTHLLEFQVPPCSWSTYWHSFPPNNAMWLASGVLCKSYHVSCKAQVWWSFQMEVLRKDVSPHKKNGCLHRIFEHTKFHHHFGILDLSPCCGVFYRAGKPGTITLIVVFHHRYTNSNGFYNWNNMSSHIWHLINTNWYNRWKGKVIAPLFWTLYWK